MFKDRLVGENAVEREPGEVDGLEALLGQQLGDGAPGGGRLLQSVTGETVT